MELTLDNVSAKIGGQKILDGVNMTVRDGEFVSLLGVSGSGKTTLLKMVAGIVPSAGGRVLLGGKNAEGLPPNKRGAVIVFQDFRLFPHMTAAENIAFPLKMRGAAKKERLAAASILLEKVRLDGFENRMPGEMSGGQVQRVALARALAAEPNVLLLDEPFSSLDENLRREMRALVRALHREFGTTTVLVTHDREEALMMSGRVALIMQGKVIQYDTPKNMFESPVSPDVADYLGDTVYLPGTVKGKMFESNHAAFKTEKPDGEYRAMFRPSAVRLKGKQPDGFFIRRITYQGERYELEMESNGLSFVLRVPEPGGLQAGDSVALDFDMAKAVLFKNE
jgi:putative spermidine/putrescine transport system ATP-binding protein